MPFRKRPRVVIVGAGFGGLWVARTLKGAEVDVVLVDRNNFHTFLPLLYQVASAELEPEQIGYPVRSILRSMRNIDFMMADVKRVNLDDRIVETDGPKIPYDYLVLAMGSATNFFNVPGAEKFAYQLKSLEHAVELRNHILCCFEQAAHVKSEAKRRQLLAFTVVGGGATGLEFSGAVSELIHGPLARDFPMLDFKDASVVLLEASDRLLPGMPERLQKYALARLEKMGVDVRLNAAVSEIRGATIRLKGGDSIKSETVVWTAGVSGNPRILAWGLPTTANGRVAVEKTLHIPGRPEAYVIGDLAYFEDDGRPLPMIAPVAIQQGTAAALNILKQIEGKEPQPFRYFDKGAMATIGRNSAVVRVGSRTFTGFFAWIVWLFIHLLYLIGFRNRLFVMLNWSWDYFLFERAIRLIFPTDRESRCRVAGETVLDGRREAGS
ncbi:MAG: NAD(P)/FAD-dependent oxidoreductase [Actinobacteria bacterium]|nr:NAD(P)/FAD-dependent oxidoreductase [Actinomycetota bacterium]